MNLYRREAEKLLRKMGATSNYYGFKYIIHGIQLIIDNPEVLTNIYKGLYIDIALHHRTSPLCVERDIRTVKELIWKKSDRNILYTVFNGMNEPPCNSIFLDCLTFHILDKTNYINEK